MRTPLLTPEDILTFRANLKMTQEEFAQYLEVSLATVGRWELKKQPVSRLASNYVRLLRELWEDTHEPNRAELE